MHFTTHRLALLLLSSDEIDIRSKNCHTLCSSKVWMAKTRELDQVEKLLTMSDDDGNKFYVILKAISPTHSYLPYLLCDQ